MPASFSPLDKIRIEWFKWHYWYDNDFPYFPDTPLSILCEDSSSALLTLPSNLIPRANSSHGAGHNTDDFQPTCPHSSTCLWPLSWPVQEMEAALMHMVDSTQGHACYSILENVRMASVSRDQFPRLLLSLDQDNKVGFLLWFQLWLMASQWFQFPRVLLYYAAYTVLNVMKLLGNYLFLWLAFTPPHKLLITELSR